MPIPLYEAPVSDQVRAAAAAGWEAYEVATDGFDLLEMLAMDDADRAAIDAVLLAFVADGVRFSANDIRPLLPPGVRKALISRRLIHWQREGLIEHVGFTPSTLESTKNAKVQVYRPRKRDDHPDVRRRSTA